MYLPDMRLEMANKLIFTDATAFHEELQCYSTTRLIDGEEGLPSLHQVL